MKLDTNKWTVPLAVGAAALVWSPGMVVAQSDEEPSRVEYSSDAPTLGSRLSLRVEPGIAVPLSAPQSQLYGLGVATALKLNLSVTDYLEVGPTLAVTSLTAGDSMSIGGSWGLGAGARLRRPREVAPGARASSFSPWAGLDLLYVRTGELNRPGLAAAAGVAFPIGKERKYWLGPFVRYFQIHQSEKPAFDDRDAKIMSIGLSLEVGAGVSQPRRLAEVAEVQDEPVSEPAAPVAIADPDRDGDGISDGDDNCPDVAGPRESDGCPAYKKVVVKKDKLEVTEKIAFKWDSAELEPSSYPALDEVVQALNDNKSFRVQIQGHASSEGSDAHNQELSEERATAVLDYLASQGVAPDRLSSKGFSSDVPVVSNETSEGREENRRVEFSVTLIIVKENTL